MNRIDRYILRMLLARFAFFVLVLAGLYWINRSILTFKRWVVQGHELSVIIDFIFLTFPDALFQTTPIAAFAASVMVFSRLISDREMVIIQSVGWSPLRIARPVFIYGLLIAALLFLLSGFGVPWARVAHNKIVKDINHNFSVGLLQPGRFIHPVKGVTIFIGNVDKNKELSNWFLFDQRDPENITVFNAKKAIITESQAGPKIVLENGTTQTISRAKKILSSINFGKTAYDLNNLVTASKNTSISLRDLTLGDLWRASEENISRTNSTLAGFSAEINFRLSSLLLPLVFSLIGLGCILSGDFSRFGLTAQILTALTLSFVVQIIFSFADKISRFNTFGFGAPYVVILIGLSLGMAALWFSGRTRRAL